MTRPKVGVLLAGCGVYDGAEIHEAVITLLALDRAGVEVTCMAPNVDQLHVINHLTGDVAEGERRNVLVEAARIARGAISDLAAVDTGTLDALILTGGFGAAKNLCDFAIKGAECSVHPEVARVVKAMHAEGKPIGAMCIAPAVIAKILGMEQPRLTIGSDAGTAAALEAMHARHEPCRVEGVVVDRNNLLVTTPAYMLAQSIAEAATGIEKLVCSVLALVTVTAPA